MSRRAAAPVVVGVDGSARALAAVEVAATEAALRRRRLRVVHAYAWPTAVTAVPPGVTAGSREAYHDRAEDVLAEAARLAGKVAPEVPVTTELVNGAPDEVLRGETRGAVLTVLGDAGLGGRLSGSVALRVAGRGDGPVLVVRGEPASTGPVVVGVDGSATSAAAVRFAVAEGSLRAAPVLAVHAGRGDRPAGPSAAAPPAGVRWSAAAEEARLLAEALAGAVTRHPDVTLRRLVVRGPARRVLADRSAGAQLVVVGDRGHGPAAGLLLGSVSDHLIRHAHCPVAVVRPDPAHT